MNADPVRSLLISSSCFPPQVGGISEMMAAIAEHLGDGRICCLTGVVAPLAGTRPTGVPVYRRPRAFKGGRAGRAVSLLAALGEILIRERPDVLQFATAEDGHTGHWLKRAIGLPYVIWAHGNEILGAARSDWDRPRKALLAADRVFANSHFTLGSLVRWVSGPTGPRCSTALVDATGVRDRVIFTGRVAREARPR